MTTIEHNHYTIPRYSNITGVYNDLDGFNEDPYIAIDDIEDVDDDEVEAIADECDADHIERIDFAINRGIMNDRLIREISQCTFHNNNLFIHQYVPVGVFDNEVLSFGTQVYIIIEHPIIDESNSVDDIEYILHIVMNLIRYKYAVEFWESPQYNKDEYDLVNSIDLYKLGFKCLRLLKMKKLAGFIDTHISEVKRRESIRGILRNHIENIGGDGKNMSNLIMEYI